MIDPVIGARVKHAITLLEDIRAHPDHPDGMVARLRHIREMIDQAIDRAWINEES